MITRQRPCQKRRIQLTLLTLTPPGLMLLPWCRTSDSSIGTPSLLPQAGPVRPSFGLTWTQTQRTFGYVLDHIIRSEQFLWNWVWIESSCFDYMKNPSSNADLFTVAELCATWGLRVISEIYFLSPEIVIFLTKIYSKLLFHFKFSNKFFEFIN